MACGGVRERDRDTKPRARPQGEVDECSDAESHGASLENTWNETETGDAWDHSTCAAAAVWENEDEYPEESCVDEAAEEASTLADNQLEEATAARMEHDELWHKPVAPCTISGAAVEAVTQRVQGRVRWEREGQELRPATVMLCLPLCFGEPFVAPPEQL